MTGDFAAIESKYSSVLRPTYGIGSAAAKDCSGQMRVPPSVTSLFQHQPEAQAITNRVSRFRLLLTCNSSVKLVADRRSLGIYVVSVISVCCMQP